MGLEATAIAQVDERPVTSEGHQVNETSGNRVAEFWAFVAEDSDVIVESPRLPGVEMPFGALMAMCAVTVTDQNVDKFYSESHMLLSAAKTKAEEPDEETEEKTEELEGAAVKEDKEDLDTKSAVDVGRPEKEASTPPKPESAKEEAAVVPGKSAFAETMTDKTADLQVVEIKNTMEEPVEAVRKTEGATAQSLVAEGPRKAADPVLENIVEIRREQPQPETDLFVQNESRKPVVEAAKTEVIEPKILQIKQEVFILPTETGTNIETQTESTESLVEQIDYEFQIPDTLSADTDEESLLEITDTEAAIEDFAIPRGDEEKSLFVLPEQDFELPSTKLGVPAEKVEETINQLATKIEVLGGEETETVHQILDEIVELPKKLEVSADGEIINEKEVRQELGNLFTDLFNRAGIEYTPELVSAFVTLTLNHQMEEALGAPKTAEPANEIPQERGTHEFLTKLLAGITKIKDALLRAYLLGKSAVRFYTLQYDFSNSARLSV